jgi:hypothetical protein
MVKYEILGDSNISRSWKAVAADSEKLKGSVLRPVTTLVLLKDTLRTVSQGSKFMIISALSNPVSKVVTDGSELALRMELTALFEEVLDAFIQTVNCNPELQVSSSY